MSNIATTVDTYLAMWNETDSDRRAKLIERAWAQDGRYVDPLLEAEGHGALSDMVAAVHEQYPGHRFRRTSGIDAHHDQVRFAWELAAPDGALTVAGIDVGTLGADGRLEQIAGFFGDVPQEHAA
jgi:SnoaL-like domain